MCCECEPGVGAGAMARSSACGCGPSFRRFYSTEEEQRRLEAYREELQQELAGVEERLSELKQK